MNVRTPLAALAAAVVLATGLAGPAYGERVLPQPVRFATYSAALSRPAAGDLVRELAVPGSPQASAAAEVLQRTRPDVVLLNDFDYLPGNQAADLFRTNYLGHPQNGAEPIDYPFVYTAPVNTGVPSGTDLNRNGSSADPDDALGTGSFEGQHGMVLLSKYPIDATQVRTFRDFKWKDMPQAMLPDDPATPAPSDWYSPDVLNRLPLSSTSHWDIPVQVGQQPVHVLASDPAAPTADGPEQRNKLRNHDEIRLWADYITPGQGGYLYDDKGIFGGLNPADSFVLLGDQNADPNDGDAVPGTIQQLLDNKRLVDPLPASDGGPEAARLQGAANATHRTDPAYDSVDSPDVPGPGNLRTDYALPSRTGMVFTASGVFWPPKSDVLSRLTGEDPFPDSAHRLVWIDTHVQ